MGPAARRRDPPADHPDLADPPAAPDAGPQPRPRNLGEPAPPEAIRDAIALAADERAVFVTEDDRLLRGTWRVTIEDRTRMIPITTRDFLDGLEAAQRINSADEVYRRAEDAGRLASRRAVLAAEHAAAQEAVARMLQGTSPER